MIRKPIVNVPKEKKAPKPLKRTLLKLSRKPIRKLGRRGVIKKAGKRDALELYFKLHGENAPCQMCGRPMVQGAHVVDACHKVRASQGGGEHPENLVIAHRACHIWQHTDRRHEDWLVAAVLVNAKAGGTIEWPVDLWMALKATWSDF